MPILKFHFAIRLMTIGIVLVSFAQQAVGQTAAPFPINNPGFEGTYAPTAECANITGTVASGWNDNTCWDETRPVIQYARDSVNPHSGTTAQKITLVSGNKVQFAQPLALPLESGRRYSGSIWMRSAAPLFATLFLRQAGPPYAGYSSKLIKLSSTWTKFDFGGVTNGGDTTLFVLLESPGTLWIDDASMQSEVATAVIPSPPTTAVPRGYFGMHFNRLDTPWPRVDGAIGAVRIWDAGENRDGTGTSAQWSSINPAAGSYDWSGLDARVAAALAQGAEVVYTLGGVTPRWASAQPDAFSPYGPGQCAEPKSDAIWQEWVRTIATRYKGKIKYWEVWNEPDLPSFYCGSPDKLVDLARQVNIVVKQVDPTNRVLTPGFSGYAGEGYLDYYLAAGGAQYADIVAYHFYVDTPEANADWRMANILSTLRRYGVQSKPFWNTEQGWIEFPPPPIVQATGAAYVARAYLLNWAYGLSRFYYYTWDNGGNRFQFVQADGVTLTPAGIAYREVAKWMTGNVMESLAQDINGTFVATLRDASGKKFRALWNPKQTIQFSLPTTWAVNRQRNLLGVAADLTGKTSVAIGESPILLESSLVASNEIIIDNLSVGVKDATRSFTGAWCTSAATNKFGGNSLYSCGAAADTYRWTPTIATAGNYDVYVWWSTHPNRSSNVPISVTHNAGTTTKNFNEKVGGGQWVLHGRYSFVAGSAGFITVTDVNGQAAADAVRLVPTP